MADEPSPEQADSTASPEEPETVARNPGAGCIIMITAIVSLAFLVGFGIWNLFKLDRELAKFTESEARPTVLPDLEANAAAVNVLNSKLETFKTEEGRDRPATLTVTPEEINLALAAFEEFEELRETFTIKSIKNGELHIDISFKLRGSPTKGGFRYLNATMIATPELAGGEIHLVIDRIEVPGKTVPEGFIGQLSPYRLTERYLEDETLGPWMAKLTSLSLGAGTASLTVQPGEIPPASEPPELETEHIIRAVALFGVVLLVFISLVVFAVKRGRKIRAPE